MKRSVLTLLAALTLACSDDTMNLDPTACENNDGCPADQWCNGGSCEPGTGNACTTDEECKPGETCDIVRDCGATRCSGNTCVPQSCTSHDQCWPDDGFVCRDGTCQPPEACDDTGNCLDDLFCNGDNLCVPPDGTCTDDEGCPGDLICVASACVTPTPCTTSDECPPSQNCIQGVCDDPCTENADCGSPAQAYLCDAASGDCFQRCLNDDQCPAGHWCDDEAAQGPGGLCILAECTTDAECDQANDEVCDGKEDGRGHCVMVVRCDQAGGCPPGFACDTATNTCEPVPACRTDRDCEGSAYCDAGYCIPADDCSAASCPTDFECIGDVCVPAVCRSNADCTVQGEVCIAGACMTPPAPDQVVEVRIITPAGVVRPATTYAFTALALDQAGRAVPGVTFEWLSSDTDVATIDADGLATGGNTEGVTEIRARVQTTGGPVTSTPVELTNLGAAPAQVHITVVRTTNGTPISGAQVELTSASGTEISTTDQRGLALFTNTATPFDVTVAHADHDYVSVMGATSTDLVVPLPAITRPDVAAGIKGTVDLSQVTTQGGLSLSLSGASMPSPLHTFDAAGLFGGDLIQVNVPMVGDIGIPAGNTVEVDLMGFQVPLKTEYYATAQPGVRAIWTFGGRIGIDGGTFGNLNNLIALLIPYFQRFEHGVVPTTTLVGIPTVVDTADFDGDGDVAETIPDWNSFPAQPMQPVVSQSLRYQLSVDNLPFVSGGNANTLVVIAGALLPGVGFVPLGLDGQTDDNGNGIVQAFVTKTAPAHGGLEAGEYAVIASAVRIDGALPGPGSVRMYVGDSIPTSVDLSDGWLDSPIDATWSGPAREVGLPALPGADLFRVAFTSPDGGWHVYGPAPAGGTLAIPPAPAGLVDRTASATVTIDAVDLEQGADPGTLFELTGGGTLGIDRVTRGFSRAIVGRQ